MVWVCMLRKVHWIHTYTSDCLRIVFWEDRCSFHSNIHICEAMLPITFSSQLLTSASDGSRYRIQNWSFAFQQPSLEVDTTKLSRTFLVNIKKYIKSSPLSSKSNSDSKNKVKILKYLCILSILISTLFRFKNHTQTEMSLLNSESTSLFHKFTRRLFSAYSSLFVLLLVMQLLCSEVILEFLIPATNHVLANGKSVAHLHAMVTFLVFSTEH